jgi:hypothetical protein
VESDFREQLVDFAKKAVVRSGRVDNEQATRQFLIIPFLELLGYDPYDPDEIVPEADASFSDKFKNKVDYAIYRTDEPVIAIESKKVGSLNEANKGELKGYFNAMPSVKLGILTDGLVYQLFSDTRQENMMDDQPFVVNDLKGVAQNRISDTTFDALLKLRKGIFNPDQVGKDAQRKLYVSAYLDVLEQTFKAPQREFVRALMDLASVEGNRTSKLVEEQTAVVLEALRVFFDKKLLERVGFANREDIVRVPEAEPTVAENANGTKIEEEKKEAVQTTKAELLVFDYVKRRLPFLMDRDDGLFQKLDQIFMRDRKTTLNVSYKLEQKGKLFGFKEGEDPKYRFEFAGSGARIETNNLSDIDKELLTVFLRRVKELG